MNLLKSTNSAVAVGDSLTVLIDWVSIANLGGWVVMVENAGGGSGDDISDVVIDTSIDGGVTVLQDQFAGYPVVPIVAGTATATNRTETPVYVRVRAMCADGEDTTAKAYLMTSASDGSICTLSDIKVRLGIEDKTEFDTVIKQIISSVESIFDAYTCRKLIITAADVTEYITGCGRFLQLRRYPVASITSIKETNDYDFDNADVMVANTDYRLLDAGNKGVITKLFGPWYDFPDGVQVIYRGGYVPADQTVGSGETAIPADLREAAIMQATFIFKRRDDIGLTGVSFNGGDFTKFSAMDLLPLVKDILDNYKRKTL
jgi:hypothetical protein